MGENMLGISRIRIVGVYADSHFVEIDWTRGKMKGKILFDRCEKTNIVFTVKTENALAIALGEELRFSVICASIRGFKRLTNGGSIWGKN